MISPETGFCTSSLFQGKLLCFVSSCVKQVSVKHLENKNCKILVIRLPFLSAWLCDQACHHIMSPFEDLCSSNIDIPDISNCAYFSPSGNWGWLVQVEMSMVHMSTFKRNLFCPGKLCLNLEKDLHRIWNRCSLMPWKILKVARLVIVSLPISMVSSACLFSF